MQQEGTRETRSSAVWARAGGAARGLALGLLVAATLAAAGVVATLSFIDASWA